MLQLFQALERVWPLLVFSALLRQGRRGTSNRLLGMNGLVAVLRATLFLEYSDVLNKRHHYDYRRTCQPEGKDYPQYEDKRAE